jgi:citrate/tricarballylate utilization protein
MGPILIIHLSTVVALFITAPYGKFVHFVYRTLALVRFQIEAQGVQPKGGH